MKKIIISIITYVVFGTISSNVFGQVDTLKHKVDTTKAYISIDTSKVFIPVDSIHHKQIPEYKPKKRIPARAALYSTLVPGLGQIYNGKYWKLPIIYGGFTTFYFLSIYNNNRYNDYKHSYRVAVDPDFALNNKSFFPKLGKDELKKYMEDFRRNRDLNYILFAAVYLLNIVDASVDAHLMDYDIGDDLTFKFQPMVFPSIFACPTYGFSLYLQMK